MKANGVQRGLWAQAAQEAANKAFFRGSKIIKEKHRQDAEFDAQLRALKLGKQRPQLPEVFQPKTAVKTPNKRAGGEDGMQGGQSLALRGKRGRPQTSAETPPGDAPRYETSCTAGLRHANGPHAGTATARPAAGDGGALTGKMEAASGDMPHPMRTDKDAPCPNGRLTPAAGCQ